MTPELFWFTTQPLIRTPWGPKRQFYKSCFLFLCQFGWKMISNQKLYFTKIAQHPKIHLESNFHLFILRIVGTRRLFFEKQPSFLILAISAEMTFNEALSFTLDFNKFPSYSFTLVNNPFSYLQFNSNLVFAFCFLLFAFCFHYLHLTWHLK